MLRVFLGAPSKEFLLSDDSDNVTFEWRTVSAPSSSSTSAAASKGSSSNSFMVTPDAYEAASVRISNFYQNTIFHDDEDNDEEHGDHDHTTFLTWPPTFPEGDNETRTRADMTIPSFLLHGSSTLETGQETQLSSSQLSQTFSYSQSNLDLSHSIAHFPSFHFNPNSLSSLSLLTNIAQKVNLLFAVLEVDGPDMVKIKNGPDAGKEVAVLRMIVGDEEGRVGKLTAWRQVAEMWGGGVEGAIAVRRGDAVLTENVNGSRDAQTSPSLTASPYLGSKLTICYRTLPREDGDQKLRPDLRLGATDAAVRKVAGVVKWFERMAGLQ
ncbi:hypothetical protein AX15_001375 [Amanita polypyramis BW_CC]|nr:hypothetical protein AX15_001375 [Amanita polypyramis BW_CC]